MRRLIAWAWHVLLVAMVVSSAGIAIAEYIILKL